MSNLTPTATFDSVAQLEITTVALGGSGAPMNVQAQALLNRTQYLFVTVSNLAAVASSGDYNSLIHLPALGTAAYQSSSAFATAAQGAKADGAAQAGSLASVAFSGSYSDLINKPFSSDAPSDSNIYGRRNGSWVVAIAASSPVTLSNTSAWLKNQYIAPIALTYAATVTPDASASNNFQLIMGGACTLANPTNLQTGMVLNFCIDQDATGGRALTLGSLYKFPGGAVPTWVTTASAKNFISAYYDGSILRCNGGLGYA
jgi:hypothetical protein